MRHFEWVTQGSELPLLRPISMRSQARQSWRSRFQFGVSAPQSPQVLRYSVAPVRPTVFAAARDHLIEHCSAKLAPALDGDPPANRFVRLTRWVIPLVLRYETSSRSLVIESETTEKMKLWAEHSVTFAGEAVDEQLRQGGAWQVFVVPPQ